MHLFAEHPPVDAHALEQRAAQLVRKLAHRPILRGATRRDQAVAISAPGRRETDRFDPTIAFGVPKLHEPMRHKRCDDIVDRLPRQQRVLADRPLRRPIMVLEVVQNAHHIIRHSGSASVILIRHVNAMQFIEEQIDMTRDR